MNQEINECDYSIIITSYNEEKTIDEFIERLINTIRKLKIKVEIIIVNDGSKDKTWEKLKLIYEKFFEVSCVINFFRNAGQGPAMTAGVVEAKGADFIFIDSDLQIDPEDLEIVLKKYLTGFDAVVGYRIDRIDPFFRKVMSKMANYVLRRVSRSTHPDLGCNLRVINGKLVRSFRYSDRKSFDSIEILSKAGSLGVVKVRHHARKYGTSGWNFFTLFKFFINKFLQMNDQMFQYLGLVLVFLSFLIVVRLIISNYIDFSILPTITLGTIFNLIIFVFLMLASLLIFLGEYVIRIYKFVEGNPLYVIKDKLRK